MDYDEGEGSCYDDEYNGVFYEAMENFISWEWEYDAAMEIEAERLDDLQECWGERKDCIVVMIEGVHTCVTHNNPYENEDK